MIAGMITAILMVVQPTYALNKHFNIHVTISEFTMDLLKSDGSKDIIDWGITVPPGGAITMTAMDAVMVSLTGDLPQYIEIATNVINDRNWTAIMPDPSVSLVQNEFILEVAPLNSPPDQNTILAPSDFHPVTDNSLGTIFVIDNTANQDQVAAWLFYKFKAGPGYTDPDANLEVKIEARPQ